MFLRYFPLLLFFLNKINSHFYWIGNCLKNTHYEPILHYAFFFLSRIISLSIGIFFLASLVTLMGSSGWKITAWETWVWREGQGNSLGGKILRRLMVIAHGMSLVPVVSRARQDWAWIFLGRKIVLESIDIPLGRGFKSGIWEVKRNSDIIPTLIKTSPSAPWKVFKRKWKESRRFG